MIEDKMSDGCMSARYEVGKERVGDQCSAMAGIAVDQTKPLVACRLVSVLFDLGVRSAGTSERRAEAYYKKRA